MKKNLFVIGLVSILLVAFATVVVFATHNKKEEKNLTTKVEEQIDYIEDKIIAMMNHLNQIRFSNSVLTEKRVEEKEKESQQNQQESSKTEEENANKSSSTEGENSQKQEQTSSSEDSIQYEIKSNSILNNANPEIDWEYMKTSTEMMYFSWPSMLVDLNELKVKNEDILSFSTTLDKITMAVKQEDKTTTLNNLASLYSLLPLYRSQISQNHNAIYIDFTKACVLNSYALVEQEKWQEAKEQLQNANTYFSNIMNSIEEKEQSQISKIYVLLNELSQSLTYEEKELFFIKYRNAMEGLIHF